MRLALSPAVAVELVNAMSGLLQAMAKKPGSGISANSRLLNRSNSLFDHLVGPGEQRRLIAFAWRQSNRA
jgi:hypothetical protein